MSVLDDSALYTGVDGEPDGIFGNEEINQETDKILQEQRQLMGELTPKLQSIVDMIDSEISVTMDFISEYVDNTKDDNELFRGELKAAARYKKYLSVLKTKFALALNEANKNGN